jgi:hypothetical protein
MKPNNIAPKFKISTVIGDPNCTKCNGNGFILSLGVGEYDEWNEWKQCSCVKLESSKEKQC